MTSNLRGLIASITILSLLALSSCGRDGPTEPPAQVPSLINLSAYEVILTAVGETTQISATVLDQNSSTIAGARATWTSRNTNIATVSAGGTVTAVSNGTTQIVATFNQTTASATVTVRQEPASITISPESETLPAIGATVQMTAEVFDGSGTTISDAPVQWSSSRPAVATVNANGLVTAVSRGTTQISATSGNASMLAPVLVEVPQEAFSISLNISSATLSEVGESLSLSAIVYDIDGAAIPGAEVTWESSDPSVATVSVDGLVIAISNGTTRVTAMSGSASTFAVVSVVIEGPDPGTVTGPSPDREALVSFYNATDGQNWTSNAHWLSEEPVGDWYGVTIDANARVVRLELMDNSLKGQLPDELGTLDKLRELSISNNEVTGSLPSELGNLENLIELSAQRNQLSGSIPSEIGQLASLRILDLEGNQLSGSIPSEIGQLQLLNIMSLRNNALNGSVPAQIGMLVELQDLWLNDNQLFGPIPSEIGQMKSLKQLWLQNNMLSGGLPRETGQLAGLVQLRLEGNADMAGPLPDELTSVPLELLRLSGTQLCAPLDASFQTWLAGIRDRSVENCSATPPPPSDPDPDLEPVVVRIEVRPPSATLISVGETEQLTATSYDTNTDVIPGATVTWTSSDPSVVTVNGNGLVKAVARGSATITATSGNVSGEASIMVELPPERVEVDPSSAMLTSVGATQLLTAMVYDTNDDIITDAPVAWTSDDPSVATVNRNGLVTAIGGGDATITATTGSKTGSAAVTVAVTGARIEIVLSSVKLTSVGGTEQLSLKVYDSNDNVIADAPVTWSSSNPAVATVDTDGLVKAVARGNTTITATSGSMSTDIVITVDLPPARIEINPPSATLTSVGDTEQLNAAVYDVNDDVISDAKVTWESDDPSVAKVSGIGLVTAVAQGSTMITATSGVKSATASITVNLPPARIALDSGSKTLTSVGATVQLSATVYDLNRNAVSRATVAWESDDPSVATVSASGLVTAVARGSTVITATLGGLSATASITVDLPAARIALDSDSETLTSVGATVQLSATVYDVNNDAISGATVVWESGDTSVATVSASGLVTAVARGSASITATSGGKSATASITVDLPAARIDIDPGSVSLTSVDETEQLSATVYDANNDEITGATVTWVSGKTTVATVSTGGLVTAVADGSTSVTARSGSVSASIQVRVSTHSDRAALVAIYNATDGDNWKVNTNWLSDKPIGEWAGVTTNSSGRVTSLSLRRNNLKNSLPAALGDLTELTNLDLHGNTRVAYFGPTGLVFEKLGGSIPTSLGNLRKLTNLDLSTNGFTSLPSTVSNLSRLKIMYVSANDLTSLPSTLGNMTNLTHLSAHFNELTSIPTTLGNMSSMEQLTLSENEITGSIPSSLGNLSNLTVLWLQDNELSGSIPTSLTNLDRLQILYLRDNDLSGCIPPALHDVRYNDLVLLGLDDCGM